MNGLLNDRILGISYVSNPMQRRCLFDREFIIMNVTVTAWSVECIRQEFRYKLYKQSNAATLSLWVGVYHYDTSSFILILCYGPLLTFHCLKVNKMATESTKTSINTARLMYHSIHRKTDWYSSWNWNEVFNKKVPCGGSFQKVMVSWWE